MIQRTYHITDFDTQRYTDALKELSESEEYQNASQVLAVIFEQCWDTSKIVGKTKILHEILPKAEIVGITHHDDMISAFEGHENTLLTFMMFEAPAFSLVRLPLNGLSDEEAGRKLGDAFSAFGNIKSVWFFISEFMRGIEDLLGEADCAIPDVPLFGSTAGRSIIFDGTSVGYIFDENSCSDDTLAAVLFTGKELHISVSYNYGWTPVGKTMEITGTDGGFCVTSIDGAPAADIFCKYLGLTYDDINIPNICEFPLIFERGGFTAGKTPYRCGKKGELEFGVSVKGCSSLRFSYGAQSILLSETYDDSVKYGRFFPQAMILVVCMNRLLFLKEDENKEINYYRRICPSLAFTHGNSEIYRLNGKGGELHGALVAFGIREGEQDRSILQCSVPPYSGKKDKNTVIPLERRISSFMYAVTEDLERMTERANAANEAKSAFLANMSHDIRTPINAVLGMNEMILRECEDDNILSYAGNIRTAGNTLLGLVNDILDFSKIEAGKMDIIPVEYDLASLLNDLVNMIKTRADAKGLTLKIEADEHIPRLLYGDEIRIKQIITNILTNAVKYTEKGTVSFGIGFEKKGHDSVILKVSVADTGIGIKQEDIPRLFSQFERIEEKRNRGIEGTGLGMNITQRLLSMMNSRLYVESVYGRGSTFFFRLEQKVVKWEPVGDFGEAFRRSLSDRKKYRESFTAPDAEILVADDTPVNLEVFVNLLKKTLVKIDTAAGGAECISLAAKKKYDIIFLDHMMPGKDGIETLKELRADSEDPNTDTPAVCLTANAVSGAKEAYIGAGFNDYLSKPIEPDRLEEMLLEYLPEDKVTVSEKNESKEEEPENVIPDLVLKNSEIDVKEGLRHCGSAEIYLRTLTTYAASVGDLADEIEIYRNNRDIKNLTVKVHAIKSTSRMIGALELGSLAERLEAAGQANDIPAVEKEIDLLLSGCRKLGTQLLPLIRKDDLPLISADELREAYTLIREFLSVEDYESAVQIVEELKGYDYPESEKQRCEALIKAAAEFDYDKISDIILGGK